MSLIHEIVRDDATTWVYQEKANLISTHFSSTSAEVGLFPILHYFDSIFPESCSTLRKFTAHVTKKTLLMAHFTNCDKSTRYRFFSSPKPFLEIDPGTFFGFESIARNDSAITTIMSPRRVPTQFRLKPTRYGLSTSPPSGPNR